MTPYEDEAWWYRRYTAWATEDRQRCRVPDRYVAAVHRHSAEKYERMARISLANLIGWASRPDV